jgi:hypothetical protein
MFSDRAGTISALSARFAPTSTVSGGNILSMLAAMGPFRRRGEQILAEHGIGAVQADGWYPLAAYVGALRTIGEKMGPNTLFQIGRQIPNHVQMPPGIDTFPKVLASFGMAFDMNHQGGPAAGTAITFRQHSDTRADITSGTPYPCDFDRGVITGFFQSLLSTRVGVQRLSGTPCKAEGADTCTYEVVLPPV